MLEDLEEARRVLEVVYKNAGKPEYYLMRVRWKPRCLLGLGELWLQSGDADKAESFLSELVEHQWTDQFPYKKYQVRAHRLKGQILSARDQPDRAEAEMRRALTEAKELSNPTQLWKTHQTMGNLLLKQGKNDGARAEFQSAVNVIHNIAEDLTDLTLKEGYLQSKPIQELLAQAEGR
jgi:tetratricopeptide (TPR) repeat protein